MTSWPYAERNCCAQLNVAQSPLHCKREKNVRLSLQMTRIARRNVQCYMFTWKLYTYGFSGHRFSIHSSRGQPYDRSIIPYNVSSLQKAKLYFLSQSPLTSRFLKVTQQLLTSSSPSHIPYVFPSAIFTEFNFSFFYFMKFFLFP